MTNLNCLQQEITDLPELQTKVRDANAPDPAPYIPSDELTVSSTYFRVESQAVIDGQAKKKVVAVFHRETGGQGDQTEPPKMVYFKIE